MEYYKKLIAISTLSLTSTFTALAHGTETPSPQTQTDTPAAINSWYNKLRPLSFLRAPEEQCAPVHDLDNTANTVLREKAEKFMDIFKGNAITRKIASSFQAQQGALCFVDFEKEYGGHITAGALHFKDYNAIILNSREDEGCTVSATIHEMHHAAQQHYGYPLPLPDLTIKEQEKYVLDMEYDAHVMQAIGSWSLAQPEYTDVPYEGALKCLVEDKEHKLPYMQEAVNQLQENAERNPASIPSGQAARQLYEIFKENTELTQRYRHPLRYMYICQQNPHCLRPKHTLKELNVNMDALGMIHYKRDYRALPYKKPAVAAF